MKKRIGLYLLVLVVFLFCHHEDVQAKISQKQPENYANVVLFAHFPGRDANFFTENRQKILDVYNGSSARSMTNYMEAISYGKFHLKNVFPQDNGTKIDSYALPFSMETAQIENIDYSIIQEMIANIPGVKDQVIDYNNDGRIDNLTIVLNGVAADDRIVGSTLLSHENTFPGTDIWSGKQIGTYNMVAASTILDSDAGVITHEFLHSLGYPDLYTNGIISIGDPVYIWDIMASANSRMPYPLAYMRMCISNWIDLDTITESQSVTLDLQTSAEGNQAYVIRSPLNEQELFVVEFRKRLGDYTTFALDGLVGEPGGVIVYRVDTTITDLSNFHNAKPAVYVFRPQPGQNHYSEQETTSVYYAALSKENERETIGSADPNATLEEGALTFSDGTNSGIIVSTESSYKGDQMTVNITVPEAKDYDIWENTNFPDSETAMQKVFAMEVYDQQLFLVKSADGTSTDTYIYQNGQWEKQNSINDGSVVSSMKLVSCQEGLFLMQSQLGQLKLMKWNPDLKSWNQCVTINDYMGYSDLAATEEAIYFTYVASDGGTARLGSYSAGHYTDLGAYKTGDVSVSFNNYLGETKICTSGHDVYVAVRDAANHIYLSKYIPTEKIFTLIPFEYESNTYDVAFLHDDLYVVLGTNDGNNMKLYHYTNGSWNTIETELSCFEPKLTVTQGNLYVMYSNPGADNNVNTKVCRLDEKNQVMVAEGIDVDSKADDKSLLSLNGTLYAGVKRSSTGMIVIKKKQTAQRLLSLSIQSPNKTSYLLGDTVSLDGLEVYANYTHERKRLLQSEYRVTNFDANTVGERQAKIEYEGVSNGFNYTVLGKANPIEAAPTATPTPSVVPTPTATPTVVPMPSPTPTLVPFPDHLNTYKEIEKNSEEIEEDENGQKPVVKKPVIKKVYSKKRGQNCITWKKCKSASGYVIYRQLKNKKMVKIKTIKGNKKFSFIDKKAKSKKKYRYALVAYQKVSGKTWYSKKTKTKYLKTK